jgi:hypothetical protein
MVFVSSIDLTFSWMFLPLFWDGLLWWSTFFLLWNMSSEPFLFVGFWVLRGLLISLYLIVLSHVQLHVPPSEFWKLHRRLAHMSLDLLCWLSGLGLIRGLLKLTFEKDLTCFVVWVAYACLEVCLSSFHKTLGSPLQGLLASLIEFDALFDLAWAQGGVWSFALINLMFWLLPSWVGNLVFAIHMTWFEGELVLYHIYCIFCLSLAFFFILT